MRETFTMTEEQREKLLDASKPTLVMYLSGGVPMGSSPQENANRAWKALGDEMGFEYMSVQPYEGDVYKFTAVKSNKGDLS